MPGTRHPGHPPGPLANLPRPLDERDGSRRQRRIRRAASLVVVVGVTSGIAATLANGPLGRAGEVQGAVATPEPIAIRATLAPPAALVQTTPRPTPVEVPGPPAPPTPAPPETLEGYRSPLPHGRLTLPFGPSAWGSRLVEGQAFHDGIDLATFCGDRIKAAHDGKVVLITVLGGMGTIFGPLVGATVIVTVARVDGSGTVLDPEAIPFATGDGFRADHDRA